ncbi:MAG: sporulation integral membrane protein YlbJ [Patescibacteria group bacterium]
MRLTALNRAGTAAGAVLAGLLTFSLVLFPEHALRAASEGMRIFWEIVFPSLLPFFVLSEILLGLGVVHFLGVLLEPLMRPVFNVPGVGAFAMSMGLAAGYPMDAVITAKFRRKGLCTRVEGERLLAFTNTADPLFIFGAVAVGMFGRPRLGSALAVAHYLSSFTVGVIFRFHHRGQKGPDLATGAPDGGMLRRAARALVKARREDGRPFGRILGEAVKESVATLLMICGFIMLFSVLVRIMTVIGLTGLLAPAVGSLLRILGLSPHLVPSILNGALEIDLGAMAAAKAAAPLVQRAIAASAVIAWSGLSVHGQVATVVNGTDIRMGPYVFARLCHAVLAGVYTLLILTAAPLPVLGGAGLSSARFLFRGPLARWTMAGWQLAVCFAVLACLGVAAGFCRRYSLFWRGFGGRAGGGAGGRDRRQGR